MSTTTITTTDRITKTTTLRAPLSRVWRALSEAEQFGAWFGARLDGSFAEGAHLHGEISSSECERVKFEMLIERIEPERYFSYRWHPYSIDPQVDYSSEPTTLVEFRLEEANGETLLTIEESGFDRLPASRRDLAFRKHGQGWAMQAENLQEYVTQA